ncbi:Dipeptidyl peptidase 1 [Armadillidium vulgare]|nr:Dipeptidyl peptidase 1 [Armadillidium vulgare]
MERWKRLESDLKSNLISKVFTSLSDHFPALNDLRLPRNQIDDEAFKNLTHLFDALPNLKSLDLNRNLIRRPQSLKFKNLTNLSVLKLKRNKIEELPDGLFYGLSSLTTLRLDNNTNITEISNGWLFEQRALKILSLSHNNIGIIKENAWETTTSLSVLDLSYNKLGCSHNEPSFKALSNIQKLFLSHNCLSTLDKNTFGELPKLKILDLSYNQLQWSIEDDTGAFQGLRSLVSLNLAYNKIETIHGKALHPLSSLTSLDLSGNNLKTLPQNPFKNMIQLTKLYFNTSALVCDCHLAWLPEWLATQSFNSVKSTCGYPKKLEGKSIFRLQKKDFSCDVSPQPIISEYPKNQTALFGHNMTLECVAYTGEEKPSFTWMKDRKVIEPFRAKTFVSVQEEKEGQTIYKVISKLIVDNVTHYHSGSYQCVARNSFGPSYSPPANIVVHRFPYFTQQPVSVEVKEGGAVEIRCAASGYPVPDILLNKEGDFPAPREKRLFYSPNVYFIKPVLPRDDGVYICTARNEAGAVNVTARISVIYTPSFSRPLYNQIATLGQSIALECQGTGYPKPKVTWFKEDKLVPEDSNHVLVDNGQFLLLLKVEESDIGSYRCELTNTLGTQRREINLSLKQDSLFSAMTYIVIMMVVIAVMATSAVWVFVIYRLRRRARQRTKGSEENRRSMNQILGESLNPSLLNPQQRVKSEKIDNLTPLLPPSHVDGLTTTQQDSGSEHSSGKDSGVGESAQRSSEDLHPNGDIKSNIRRSLLIYPDSPVGLNMKGHSMSHLKINSEETRPKLSTFSMHPQHLDPNKTTSNYNPTYASLRRGSASRLLPVPSPVTPGMGMNSLPRHAYRNHSSSLAAQQIKYQNDRCSSLSRGRRRSRPDTPPPTGVTEMEERNGSIGGGNFRSMNTVVDPSDYSICQPQPQIAPTYYTFRNPERTTKPKSSFSSAAPNNLLPTR